MEKRHRNRRKDHDVTPGAQRCDGKGRLTESQAGQKATAMSTRFNGVFVVYPCSNCGTFHVGRSSKVIHGVRIYTRPGDATKT
jgi:hypothetical protein